MDLSGRRGRRTTPRSPLLWCEKKSTTSASDVFFFLAALPRPALPRPALPRPARPCPARPCQGSALPPSLPGRAVPSLPPLPRSPMGRPVMAVSLGSVFTCFTWFHGRGFFCIYFSAAMPRRLSVHGGCGGAPGLRGGRGRAGLVYPQSMPMTISQVMTPSEPCLRTKVISCWRFRVMPIARNASLRASAVISPVPSLSISIRAPRNESTTSAPPAARAMRSALS